MKEILKKHIHIFDLGYFLFLHLFIICSYLVNICVYINIYVSW